MAYTGVGRASCAGPVVELSSPHHLTPGPLAPDQQPGGRGGRSGEGRG